MIVDVDAHAEPDKTWLDEVPDLKERLSGRFPESDPRIYLEPRNPEQKVESAMFNLSGNVQRGLPADQRLPLLSTASPFHLTAHSAEKPDDFIYEGAEQFQPIDAVRRLAWMDRNGIDVQNVITAKGIALARQIEDPALGMEAIEYLNTWMSDRLAGHSDRQKLVASVRFEDMDWAIGELTRMRERGCRAFIISGEPVNMIPPYDPSYDRLWSAACDLGMVATLHVGMGPAYWHPGWGNTQDPAMLTYLASSCFNMNAHIMINALVFGGVFDRHPKLTLVVSEFGVGWLPFTVANMDARASKNGERIHGPYRNSLKPSDYVKRNIRFSTLPGQNPVEPFADLPGVAVFSSDYPHFEGHPEPIAYYEPFFESTDESTKRLFFGESIENAYVTMGDPLR
jgi:predicted TIM-barrel fold metal-dependent hydrolase